MSRAKILEDTIAALEAERYAPRPSWVLPTPPTAPPRDPARLEDWSDLPIDPNAVQHRQVLIDALSNDAVVITFREREAGACVDRELKSVGPSRDNGRARKGAPDQPVTGPGPRPLSRSDRVTSLPAPTHKIASASGGGA